MGGNGSPSLRLSHEVGDRDHGKMTKRAQQKNRGGGGSDIGAAWYDMTSRQGIQPNTPLSGVGRLRGESIVAQEKGGGSNKTRVLYTSVTGINHHSTENLSLSETRKGTDARK